MNFPAGNQCPTVRKESGSAHFRPRGQQDNIASMLKQASDLPIGSGTATSAATAALSLLLFAAATHFLVDATAGMLNPLWPRLDGHFQMSGWEGAVIFFLWQMSNSVSQFWFGMYGDRFHARWLLWAGPLIAVICLSAIGLTHSPVLLGLLLVTAGLGIAAYHPEAAALAGSCAPEHRSRAMSIFTLGGFLGQAVGPIYSGSLVDRLGFGGLGWNLLVGLSVAALLVPLGRGVFSRPAQERSRHVSLHGLFRGRAAVLALVLVVGSLRIIAAAGVPVVIGYVLTARGANASETGFVQSAFMFGIGLGGLACATLARPRHERTILWLCPLLVTPVVAVLPWLAGWLLTVATGLSGLLLGIALPVLISYGQQLMPDSQRIASSITMGVSWGVGGGVVSIILAIGKWTGHFEPAFLIFAAATALSSFLCIWLPATGQAAHQRQPVEQREISCPVPASAE